MYELTVIFVVLISILCVYLAVVSYNTRVRCNNAILRLERDNKRSISLRKMAEVEATLSDLTDAYHALLENHKKLRSRIGMRQIREQRTEIPDAKSDPAGFKKAMRLKLNQQKL